MTCDKFNRLSLPEKYVAIGELVHIFQSSDKYHDILTDVLNDAIRDGELENVKILPPTQEDINY